MVRAIRCQRKEKKKKENSLAVSSCSQFGLFPIHATSNHITINIFQVVNFQVRISFFLFFSLPAEERKKEEKKKEKRATTFAHEAHHRGVHKPTIMTGKRRTV